MEDLQAQSPKDETIPKAGMLTITAKAVEMVKATREQEGIDSSYGLRIAVRGGGCSGFQYGLDFENEQRPADVVFYQDDLKVYVDQVSARYLDGVEIDYRLGMHGAGFLFNNPNAVGTCGCGSSFSM